MVSVVSVFRASVLIFLIFGLGLGSWNRNEAHLNWKVSDTEHFRVYYDKKLEHVAEHVAGIAESVYEEKIKRYQIQLPGKVELIVKEDIFSNGWANSYQNTMQVWVTDWEIPFRSTHNWLRDVITHEFAHLVSIQSGSKLPTSIFGLVIGYQDYFNEDVQSSLTTVIPFTSQPNWFAEGVAQYESELSGHDHWDSHRDMIVRVAVLEDSLLSYDRMGTFAGKGLHYEQGPYTQGFAFVRYLARRYGDEGIRKLWVENSKAYRQTLSGAMKRMWGQSGPSIWADWQIQQKRKYTEQIEAIGTQVQGEKITEGSFFNYYPRWSYSGEHLFFISNHGRNGFGGSLYKYGMADSIKKEDRLQRVSGAVRGYYDFKKDDSTFIYASAKGKNKKGESKWDVYENKLIRKSSILDVFKKDPELQVTKEVNAINPSYKTDESKVTFVRGHQSNFTLCVADVIEKNKLDDVRQIFPDEKTLEKTFGFNIYSPKYQPNGDRIVFSFYDGQSRKIGWIKEDGSGMEMLLNRPYDDRDPYWHPNGKSFVFASDSTGIYNLYEFRLEDKIISSITNVVGGAFAPSLSSDGKHLAYVGYDKDGFSIYMLKDWIPLGLVNSEQKTVKLDTAFIEPIEFSGVRQDYLGLPNRYIFQPLLIGQEYTSVDKSGTKGDVKWLAGVIAFFNDPVRKNELGAGMLLELGKGLDYFGANKDLLIPDKESETFLTYWNHSFPVSAGFTFVRRNLVTFDTVTFQSVNVLDEDSSAVTNQAITLKNALFSLRYGLFTGSNAYDDPFKQSFFSLNMGYAWNDFNFYEIPFDFTFYKTLYISPLLWYYAVAPSSKSEIAPQGIAGFANYTVNYSSLIREGTFRETFTFENGVIKPNFRDYELHELDLGLDYGVSVPWSKNSGLRLSTSVGSVLNWDNKSGAAGADTLDSFFQRGLFLKAYPYLENTEHLLFRGENTAQIGLDFNQVILSDIFKQVWIVFLEDFYASAFWEAGRAWDGKLLETELFDLDYWDEKKQADSWYQSVGWGLKVNSRIYHNYPFNIFVEFATALNQIRTADGGARDLPDVKLFGVNTFANRINMGISLGFYNGLLGSRGKNNLNQNKLITQGNRHHR